MATNIFRPLFAPTSERTTYKAPVAWLLLRDQFRTSTIALMGAAAMAAMYLLTGSRFVFVPVFAALAYKATRILLMTLGWIPNVYASDVLPKKFSALLPPVSGEEDVPASQGIVVFLLGTRNNHPLGILSPGAAEMQQYVTKLMTEVNSKYDEYGLLGSSTLMSTERSSHNGLILLMYFRDAASLHRYAHSPIHKEGWAWYLEAQNKWPHIGVMHETYDVPARSWETIYLHMHKTALGRASVRMTEEQKVLVLGDKAAEHEGEMWWSTPVDATRGKLRSSNGRMARSDGAENEKEGLGEIY